jgi:diguanylate cyclase (GGDEF)-like protein/PAS domain S-box-containing protein/excisionase family DNA binding protein
MARLVGAAMTQGSADRGLLSTGEAARRLGLSRFTLLRAVRRGEITPDRRTPGGYCRFDAATVAAYGRTLVPGLERHDVPLAQPRRRHLPAGDHKGGRVSLRQLRLAYEAMACGVLVLDRHGALASANEVAREILGISPPNAAGRVLDNVTASAVGEDGSALPEGDLPWQRALRCGRPQRNVIVGFTRRNGQRLWLQVDAVPVGGADGAIARVVISLIDVTARTQAEEALRASEARFRALSENATDLVSIADAQGIFRYVSPAYQTILGYDPNEMIGTECFDYFHPDDIAGVRQRWADRVAGLIGTTRTETRFRHADGSWRWIENNVRVALEDPAIRGIISNARDITERKRAEEALRIQALHDPLTDLPNRTLLFDRTEQAILRAQRERQPLALLLLDLDRFKEVNDTFGHHYGDILLQQAANRLRAILRAADTIARLGGDEFAILLPDVDVGHTATVAQKLAAALEEPFMVEEQPLHLKSSMGIAMFPDHGTDCRTLMRRADVAMYVAKRGGLTWAVYSPDQDAHHRDRIVLTADLRAAIDEGQLILHYQPIVDMGSGRVTSAEALVRWQHPRRGLVGPDTFIPLAEEMGLIRPLAEFVLRTALAQYRAWQRAGCAFKVGVILSLINLRDVRLGEMIMDLLHAYGVPADGLCLEMTEGSIMANQGRTLDLLAGLAAAGVHVAIDDFGTGYSSLAYLKRLPINSLKIDRSFVMDMVENEADAIIVRSTISMAHALGLRVVAEGVETAEAWAMLRDLSCDAAQGFYLSRPLPAEDLERWLRNWDITPQ